MSIDTQDVHNVIGSMMDHFNEIDNNECNNNNNSNDFETFFPPILALSTIVDNHNNTEENVNISTNEIPSMEVDEQPSILSRSQADDDIVEIEGSYNAKLISINSFSFLATSSNDSSHHCTCECHKSISPLNNEYFLFEQALKQTRLEQQNEKFLNNNRLIQTLKRQHDELINIYQQNKNQKQISIKKIDREQQTIKFNSHDSQIQTDVTTINNNNANSSKLLSQQKSLIIPTINSHNNESTSPKKYSGTLQTSTLQQIIPRLSATAIATTTITNKTSTITTKTAIVTNTQPVLPPAPPPPPPPPLLSTVVSHDIVDLTEEDEDDNANRTPLQRATATRHVN